MSQPAWIRAVYDNQYRSAKSYPYTVISTSGHVYLICHTQGYRTMYIGHDSSMNADWLTDNLAVGSEVSYDGLPSDVQDRIRAIRDRLWKDERDYDTPV